VAELESAAPSAASAGTDQAVAVVGRPRSFLFVPITTKLIGRIR
jgi:hypothetical protein